MFIETHYEEVTFLQNPSKATLAIILALVFMVAMTSAAIAGSSEFAILPAKQTILIRGGEEEGDQNRFGRQRKPTTRKYYRLQSYHRKMLYR